jgi:hypothetical protein
MSDSPGQIVCTIAHDPRLIAAGAAAVSSQVARRAGLSWEAQEEVAEAALVVCRTAFPQNGRPQNGSALRLGVSDLPDRIEVTIKPDGSHDHTACAPVATSLEQSLAEQVRCEACSGYFRMIIAKPADTRGAKPTNDSPRC